jgi:hypothetical protein
MNGIHAHSSAFLVAFSSSSKPLAHEMELCHLSMPLWLAETRQTHVQDNVPQSHLPNVQLHQTEPAAVPKESLFLAHEVRFPQSLPQQREKIFSGQNMAALVSSSLSLWASSLLSTCCRNFDDGFPQNSIIVPERSCLHLQINPALQCQPRKPLPRPS